LEWVRHPPGPRTARGEFDLKTERPVAVKPDPVSSRRSSPSRGRLHRGACGRQEGRDDAESIGDRFNSRRRRWRVGVAPCPSYRRAISDTKF